MSSVDEYYKHFGAMAMKNRKALMKHEIHNLYKKHKKDKGLEQAHFHNDIPNAIYQCDLLYLPTDDGYKYALVVVDTCTGITDAEALKSRTAEVVLEGMKTIFSRGILPMPSESIECDSGTEFHGAFKKYFNDKGIGVRYAKTGRSRQTAFAENRNRTIGQAIFKRQTAQQLLTNEIDTHWVEDLPIFIEYMNKHFKKLWNEKQKRLQKEGNETKDPILTKNTIILPIGTKVRVALDKPIESTGHKLSGRFRVTDIKWDPDIEKIENIIISPDEPVLYKVSGDRNVGVAFTYNQLQVVSKNEQEPPSSVIRGTPNQYTIKKILDKKKVKNKIFYKVWWRGYKEDESTWEGKSDLIKSNKRVKKIIDEYEASLI
jgi:hypothetical protein